MFEDVTVLAKWQPKPAGASGPGASLRRIRPDSTCSATTRGRVWARARETGRARLGEECRRDGYGDKRGGEGRKAGEDRDCDGFGHLQPLHLRAGAWRVSQPLAPMSCGQRCGTLARARTGTESFVGFLQCRCGTWSISAAAPPRAIGKPAGLLMGARRGVARRRLQGRCGGRVMWTQIIPGRRRGMSLLTVSIRGSFRAESGTQK